MSYLNPMQRADPGGAANVADALDHARVDDRRARSPQILNRAHEDLHDLRIGAVALVGEAQHADARAFQSIAHQRRGIVLRQMRRRRCRDGIGGIAADDRLKHRDGVLDGARHRPGDVGEQVQRHHARPARQPHRRPDADQRLVRRGTANGIAGVAAEPDGAEAGGDAGRGAAARPRGDAIERVRILGVARQDRAEGLDWA